MVFGFFLQGAAGKKGIKGVKGQKVILSDDETVTSSFHTCRDLLTDSFVPSSSYLSGKRGRPWRQRTGGYSHPFI